MKRVEIYTDGACSYNPGPGGWGAILIYKGDRKEIAGYKELTTNNVMELTAVKEALLLLKEKCEVKLYSDSKYVIDGITKWMDGWIKKGWKRSKNEEVKNKELWQEILELSKKHKIDWIWVKAHDGNPLNEECDKLAKQQIKINTE